MEDGYSIVCVVELAIQCDILSSGFQKPVNTLNWPPFSSILVTLAGPGGPGKRVFIILVVED